LAQLLTVVVPLLYPRKMQEAYVIDLESDNLYPLQENIWVICIKRVGTQDRLKLHPFRSTPQVIRQQILDFIFRSERPIIIGHNYLGFDGWVLWKEIGLDMTVGPDTICGQPVVFFDTLHASRFTLPDREGDHNLKSWGIRIGDNKIDYRQVALDAGIITKDESEFCRWAPQMDDYCEKDTDVCERVFVLLYEQINREESMSGFRLGQKVFFLMSAQAFTGFKFDIEKAEVLKSRIESMIEELKAEVEPELPPRKLKKAEESYYQMPAKPFVKGGAYSATLNNFIAKHNAVVLPDGKLRAYGEVFEIVPHAPIKTTLPMLLNDQNELKDYFLSIGWEPTMWNYKKDSNGKPIRPLTKTSPKIQENQKICPNLLELDGELPKKIVRFMSLRNRLSILTGWLGHPRLQWDGRLPAGSSGIANTHRQTHNTIVNVPKAQDDVLLGKEFRELFTVEDGFKLIGCDQAALEARCEAHWVHKYPGGLERAELLLFKDIHNHNTKIFFKEETKDYDIYSTEFSKDDPGFKPYRSLSKNGAYGLAYGCSPKKLATTLRKPEKDAQPLYDGYWAANPSLKALKDKVEHFWSTQGSKKWIPAIDGRRLHSRSKHSLINLLFQSTAAIIFDYALCLFDAKMGRLLIDEYGRPYYEYKGMIVKRVGAFHDEKISEAQDEIVDEVAKISEECMVEAGERLSLNVPLAGESKIGRNWAETH